MLSCVFAVPASISNSDGHLQFLVDTGSQYSIINDIAYNTLHSPTIEHVNIPVCGWNGQPHTISRAVTVQFTLAHCPQIFSQRFLVAPACHNILGSDFLRNYDVIPDTRRHGVYVQATFVHGKPISAHNCIASISGDVTSSSPVSSTCHRVTITSTPPCQRSRPLFGDKLKSAKQQVQSLMTQGTLRRSSSSFASPIVMVLKKDKTYRMCGDYRLINKVTIPDKYPLPRIHDIIHSLHGAQHFSLLDIEKAYHHIPMHPDDVDKTAIVTPFGLYEYVKMPFGLKNAASTFQRYMDSLFQHIEGVFVYIDDILVTGNTIEQHNNRLQKVQRIIKDNNLRVNDKCLYNVQQVVFLGHLITPGGIHPTRDRIDAMLQMPTPKSPKDIRRFLGMVNYIHMLIPKCSQLTAPLSKLSHATRKEFVWTSEHDAAFAEIKSILCSNIVIHPPDPTHGFHLVTDASQLAIGAVLQQRVGNITKFIGYFSRKLNSHEVNYSTLDKELLGIFAAIKYFEHILDGCDLVIETDHKPLCHIFTMKNPSPRQLRQISYISQFAATVNYIAGAENVIADNLSRPAAAVLDTPPPDFTTIVEDQRNDPQLQNLDDTDLHLTMKQGTIYDTTTGRLRLVLPQSYRRPIFDFTHNLAHISHNRTLEQISEKYVWPGMRRDISNWCKTCLTCQSSKVTLHTKAPILQFHATTPFTILHIDLVGPLPPSNGHQYLLTMIDRHTKWFEVLPLRNITTKVVIDALLSQWISRYGVPQELVTDRGTQFMSHDFNAFLKRMGITHRPTTAYHPQCNGLVERFHRVLKQSLRCHNDSSWFTDLPIILLSLRNAYSRTTGTSPAKLVFRTPLRLPGEIFAPTIIDEYVHRPAISYSNTRSFVPSALADCSHVWLRQEVKTSSLQRPYTGPYKVVSRTEKTLTLQIDTREHVVTIDRVKPVYFTTDTIVKSVTFAL